jgi:hypothetical protein
VAGLATFTAGSSACAATRRRQLIAASSSRPPSPVPPPSPQPRAAADGPCRRRPPSPVPPPSPQPRAAAAAYAPVPPPGTRPCRRPRHNPAPPPTGTRPCRRNPVPLFPADPFGRERYVESGPRIDGLAGRWTALTRGREAGRSTNRLLPGTRGVGAEATVRSASDIRFRRSVICRKTLRPAGTRRRACACHHSAPAAGRNPAPGVCLPPLGTCGPCGTRRRACACHHSAPAARAEPGAGRVRATTPRPGTSPLFGAGRSGPPPGAGRLATGAGRAHGRRAPRLSRAERPGRA